MTAILFEGFEDFSAWEQVNALPLIVPGRTANCMQTVPHTTLIYRLRYNVPTNKQDATFACGFAFKRTGLPTTFPLALISLMSDNAATTHITLSLNADNAFQVSRGNSTGAVLATSPFELSSDKWHYIEFGAYLHNIEGGATLTVDGNVWIQLVLTNTRNGGIKTVFDAVQLGHDAPQVQATCLWDDFYLKSGGEPFGDINIETLYPTSTYNNSGWTGSDDDAIDNHLLVDDVIPSMTDYIYSQTPAHINTFMFNPLAATTGTIAGVTGTLYGKKHNAADRTISMYLSGQTLQPTQLTETAATYIFTTETRADGYEFDLEDISTVIAGPTIVS